MPVVLKQDDYERTLELPRVSQREFERFSRANRDLRVERTADGKLCVMPPADAYTDSRNANLVGMLVSWNFANGDHGLVFGPSAGFTFPDGATRSPDAAWVSRTRWEALTTTEKRTFAQIVPDLVVEVMSPSDSLASALEKMAEYRANGARLGVLIDRRRRQVHLFRPQQPIVELVDPLAVSLEPELIGLTLRMESIF